MIFEEFWRYINVYGVSKASAWWFLLLSVLLRRRRRRDRPTWRLLYLRRVDSGKDLIRLIINNAAVIMVLINTATMAAFREVIIEPTNGIARVIARCWRVVVVCSMRRAVISMMMMLLLSLLLMIRREVVMIEHFLCVSSSDIFQEFISRFHFLAIFSSLCEEKKEKKI